MENIPMGKKVAGWFLEQIGTPIYFYTRYYLDDVGITEGVIINTLIQKRTEYEIKINYF